MSIGKRILQERKRMDFTQKELSDMTGIPATTISDYEKDKSEPSAKNIFKINKALKSNLNWLISGELEDNSISSVEFDVISMLGILNEIDREEILCITKMKYDRTVKKGKKSSQLEHIEENKNGSDIA